MLVDTDVLIWNLRGYAQATRRLDRLDTLTLSVVSYLELVQGMRNRGELAALKLMLERRRAYGEQRINLLGWLDGAVVHLTYTERGDEPHIISLRKAEKHEIRRYAKETTGYSR